jgi:2',3'-cyclic-nucleotide 2'-phosphodiesterase
MAVKEIIALFLGDICGQPGNRAVFMGLRQLIRDCHADLVIANGENVSDGFGITPKDAEQLFSSGVNIITTGNHVWQHDEIYPVLERRSDIIRPANYPPGVPGRGSASVSVKGVEVAVINLQGRMHMSPIDCPFRVGRELVSTLSKSHQILLVDFHAESSDEKEALGLYLDGSVAAVVGTHTHVQTADERILPKGTAYITDLGMTGPRMSVIGGRTDISIERMLTQIPLRNEIADSAACLQGAVVRIRPNTGLAAGIERFSRELSI